MNPSVVVDTNILFAALVGSRSRIREFLFTEKELNFPVPAFCFVAATELSEDELLDTLNALLARVHFVDEATIPIGTWLEARRLCRDIDKKDTPFIALTIHLNARLWTEDTELKTGLLAKEFGLFFDP